MNENSSYKILRELLRKASLKRRKSDWDNMSDLLDKHMPVSGAGAGTGFRPFHLNPFIIGVSIVVVTSVGVFLHYQDTKKVITGKEILERKITAETNPKQSDTVQSIRRTETSVNKSTGQNRLLESGKENYDSVADKEGEKTLPLTTVYSKKSVSPYTNENKKQTGALSKNLYFSGPNEKSTSSTHPLTTQEKKKQNYKQSEAGSGVEFVAGMQKDPTENQMIRLSSHGSPLRDNSNKNELLIVHEKYDTENHNQWITATMSKTPSGTLTSLNKTAGEKSSHSEMGKDSPDTKKAARHDLAGSSYAFGITLPLLQMYTGTGVQSLRVNYIPGLVGNYNFNDRLGVGITLLPFQTVNVNSRDSIFTSVVNDSLSSSTHYTMKYHVQTLNTFSASVHVHYEVNQHFKFELGLGYQHFYSGNGYALKQDLFNPFTSPSTSENIHYASSDSFAINIAKSNFYYYLNAVYGFEKWEIALGYYQNGKNWISLPSSKSSGWISLAFRYYLFDSRRK